MAKPTSEKKSLFADPPLTSRNDENADSATKNSIPIS